jgi:hypothetical protein
MKSMKLTVAFIASALVVLGLTIIFIAYSPHLQPIGVEQVDSALSGVWLRENNESFRFSVLANSAVQIIYFNGSVQTIPPNYKNEIGGLQDFGPGIIDRGGFIEFFKEANSVASLTLVVLKVNNTEANLFITSLNTTPTTIRLQDYKGYLFFIEGNSLTAVYNHKYIIYIIWVGVNTTQQQLMKLLSYLAS